MTVILWFLAIQGVLGAFDMFYHHEFKEKLPWRPTASLEMLLHGIRNFFYAVIFFSFGWVAWHGTYAWFFALIILTEVAITLWDFVEEDRTRKLPGTERVTHAVLTLNYGAIIVLFVPILLEWSTAATEFAMADYGYLSWLMALYALGVLVWGIRDLARGLKLRRKEPSANISFPKLSKPHQHILVTGGTGFIGQRLCKHLIDEGHRVTILTRNLSKAAATFSGRITFVEALDNIGNDEHIDVIINLAGEKVAQRWIAKARKEMRDSRLNLIKNLYTLLERLERKPATFIQASAIGFYGIEESGEFDENSQQHKDGSFAQIICTELEQEVKSIETLGIRTCCLRIGLVLEKDGGALRELLIPFDCGAGGRIGNGKQTWSWIHRDDVVGLILHLINIHEANGVFNATSPQPVSNKEFAKSLGKAMHRPALMPMPAFVVKLLFGQMGQDVMLQGQKVIPTLTIKSGYNFFYPNIDQAFAAIFKE
jgi:uncharacterized protein (TIGR01777 family)